MNPNRLPNILSYALNHNAEYLLLLLYQKILGTLAMTDACFYFGDWE